MFVRRDRRVIWRVEAKDKFGRDVDVSPCEKLRAEHEGWSERSRLLGAAAPEAAIAPEDERQRLLVIGPACVFRQFHLLLLMMAVDDVPDRLVSDLSDLINVSCHGLGPTVSDRIGSNHARRGNNEHGLVIAVAKDVNVISAVDLCGGKRRLLSLGRPTKDRYDQYRAHNDLNNP